MGNILPTRFYYEEIKDKEEIHVQIKEEPIHDEMVSEYLKNVVTDLDEDKEKMLKDLLALF
jgi:hypothetical protein